MNTPLISIIVPIYKVDPYLDRCILSLIKQTYTNIEIILVDDGSPDNSGKICDEYAKKDKRITVIHQQNQGVTAARYNGFQKAKGEFITFVDGDDRLPEKALETLFKETEPDIDIIIGRSDKAPRYSKKYLTNINYRKQCIHGQKLPMALWGHLYRRTLFNKEIFNLPKEIKKGEDMIMNIRLAFQTQHKIKMIPQIIYHYMYNPNSVMQKFQPSLDYEDLFQRYVRKSLPLNQLNLYMPDLIIVRLRALIQYICSYPQSKNWENHPFYIQLIQDIKCSNFIIKDSFEKSIIYTKSDQLRRKIIYLYTIKNKFIYYYNRILQKILR
ncbi:glycosyltransferase family 2 protein [uncultured Bacteroides sp.]|uniref:glycosyltransferase family 2 protein n=1 Tax=uncultured Bacteroides sp. TaxID=162156 RepID=UPI00280BE111|nr:glycosyltransferase family 2 protein [uncultured Bacteroides sp.]